jgi:CBS domain-containing protein
MTSPVWAEVKTVASHDPLFVAPNDTLRHVARTMWERSVGALLVGRPRDLLGIISERDLATALARGADPDTATAASAMSADIVSLRPGDTLYDAGIDMLDVGIRHVPVIDEHGEVQAIVSVRDLLRPLLVRALGG